MFIEKERTLLVISKAKCVAWFKAFWKRVWKVNLICHLWAVPLLFQSR